MSSSNKYASKKRSKQQSVIQSQKFQITKKGAKKKNREIRRNYTLLGKDNTSTSGKPKQNCLSGEENSRKTPRLLVHRFEIDLLAPGAREHGAELEPDEKAGEGEGEAENPEHKGGADRVDGGENGRRRGEDAGADNAANTGWRYVISIRLSFFRGCEKETKIRT